jgi:hypothetical protein
MVRGLRVEIGLHLLLAYDCVFRASAPASNQHFNVLFTAFHVSYLTSHFIIPHSLSSESSIAIAIGSPTITQPFPFLVSTTNDESLLLSPILEAPRPPTKEK